MVAEALGEAETAGWIGLAPLTLYVQTDKILISMFLGVSYFVFQKKREINMTKKKIIGLCIGAVVLAVAAAGVKEGSWLMKHRRMQNEFTHEMNAFTTKTNAELIQPTIVAEDDIYGWFFHEEDDGLYMNLYYRIKNESNQHEIASSEFPVKIKKELLADDKVWSRTTGTAKNQVHAEYLEGEDDMTVSFDVYYQCEGSCGEYFADITVTDSETGKLYYSSEAENEAAE